MARGKHPRIQRVTKSVPILGVQYMPSAVCEPIVPSAVGPVNQRNRVPGDLLRSAQHDSLHVWGVIVRYDNMHLYSWSTQ
jgi:hypothetical protein